MNAKSKAARRSEQRGVKAKQSTSKAPKHFPQPAVWPAYLSAVLLWASYPPCSLGWLAWVAPVGWLTFLANASSIAGSEAAGLSRRTYFHLWLSGCLFWLSTLQGIRLAYWPLYFGWLALSLYLAIYPPLFVGFARRLIRSGIAPWLAAPVVWTALEFVRSYMLTGFSANMLGHSQAHYTLMIQIADQLGVYGISFIIMLVSATLTELVFRISQRRTWVFARVPPSAPSEVAASPSSDSRRIPIAALAVSIGAVVATLAYGNLKLAEGDRIYQQRDPAFRCLLVQENTPTMFDAQIQDLRDAFERYLKLTRTALAESEPVDLVVWPESTFSAGEPLFQGPIPDRLPDEEMYAPVSFDGSLMRGVAQRLAASFQVKCRRVILAASQESNAVNPATEAMTSGANSQPHLLVGGDAKEIRGTDTKGRTASYNSAFFVGPDAEVLGRYDKMHLVMFGEYIPLGPALGWLREIFRIDASAGEAPKSFNVNGTKVAPNICFETMMPRVVAHQVRELSANEASPDVLINLSNDSWFRGSAMLDHHLACTMLCAVENRRPILVAANTGLSAEIDGCGRLLQVTQRLEPATIVAMPLPDGRPGLVQAMGYPLGWICFLVTIGLPLMRRGTTTPPK
ncbi:MAG: apolipoprotein N-acyltransferase [Planctomycetota bacterium]